MKGGGDKHQCFKLNKTRFPAPGDTQLYNKKVYDFQYGHLSKEFWRVVYETDPHVRFMQNCNVPVFYSTQ